MPTSFSQNHDFLLGDVATRHVEFKGSLRRGGFNPKQFGGTLVRTPNAPWDSNIYLHLAYINVW